MSKLNSVKQEILRYWDNVRDSEIYQQLKQKYDELDSQTKFYIHAGALGLGVIFLLTTVLLGYSKVSTLKKNLNEKEEIIGQLQRTADTLTQLKQLAARQQADVSSPTPALIESIVTTSGIVREKVEIDSEKLGHEDKQSKEFLVEVKLTQINLKQLTRFLFHLTTQGTSRHLNIKDLTVDTKNDPTGYLNAEVIVATYRAK